MATITQRGKRFTAQIRIAGYPTESETFDTRRDAKDWAARREVEIKQLKRGIVPKYTLLQAFERYTDEVIPLHRGGKSELRRLTAMLSPLPTSRPLVDFDTDYWNTWKQRRLATPLQRDPSKKVSSGTVRRELCDISLVFEFARRELRWIITNPLRDVVRPPSSPSRDRTITPAEVAAMFKTLNYKRGCKIVSIGQQVGAIFDLALESGMRAGEIAGLLWENVHLDKSYVYLPITKNGSQRDVPLRKSAVNILFNMQGVNDVEVFAPDTATLDAYFRKARKAAGLEGFTFHDARHTAVTNIAASMKSKGLTSQAAIMDFCKIFGWKNINQALAYFNPDPADVAARLD